MIELTGAYPALHQAIRLAGVGGTVIAAGFTRARRPHWRWERSSTTTR